MKYLVLFMALAITSCASLTKTHKGYTQRDLNNMKDQLAHKSLAEVKGILGEPVAEGSCNDGEYSMVYLAKDTGNVSFALDMSNKKGNLKCTILTLRKKAREDGQYGIGGIIFAMDQTMCDQFAIPKTRKCQKA